MRTCLYPKRVNSYAQYVLQRDAFYVYKIIPQYVTYILDNIRWKSRDKCFHLFCQFWITLAIMYYWDNHKRPHLKCWTPTGHLATLFFLKLFYASLKCKKGGFRVWKGVHFFKFKTKAYIYTFNMKVSVMEIHSIVMRNEEQNASCYISIDYCQDICWIVLV